MKTLDLHKIWQVMNTLSDKQDELSEQDKYVYLLGSGSNYYSRGFESFIYYYSFKVDEDTIVIFNDSKVPYEDFSIDDFSYLPTVLLDFSVAELDNWIKNEIARQLKKQEQDRGLEKVQLKQQIELLKKRLNNFK